MTYGPKKAGNAGLVHGRAARPETGLPDAGGGQSTTADLPRDLAHDFRTPLNIIIGFSELMLEEIPGKINEEQRRDLVDILNSGKRLLGLVNTMLERPEVRADRTP
jgi:signal transduction histidine kinase